LSSELLVANLLRVASEDLDGARLLGTANNRNAVYLCEQAAEKIIRAVYNLAGVKEASAFLALSAATSSMTRASRVWSSRNCGSLTPPS